MVGTLSYFSMSSITKDIFINRDALTYQRNFPADPPLSFIDSNFDTFMIYRTTGRYLKMSKISIFDISDKFIYCVSKFFICNKFDIRQYVSIECR